MKLMDQLSSLNIICPKPLKNKNGHFLIKLKNKTACIVSFLTGKSKKSLSLKNCCDVGKTGCFNALINKKNKAFRSNSMGIKKLKPLINKIEFKSEFKNLEKFLKKTCETLTKIGLKSCPMELFMEIYLLIIYSLKKIIYLELLIFTLLQMTTLCMR